MDRWELFFEIHAGESREGPGSSETTERALRLAGGGGFGRIIDIGCGPGWQTLDLARLCPDAHVFYMLKKA